jgi:hypothetical protein
MAKARAVKAKVTKAQAAQAEAAKLSEKKEKFFAPVEVRFSESDKAPLKLDTDSITIKLEVVDGVSMWVAENGMRFEDVKGEIGEPL